MSAPGREDELHEALGASQRLGLLGARPIPEVVEHARMYVRALAGVSGRVIDIGAGGGVPGLVIAHDRPDLEIVLVDRRQKRTDFLERLLGRYAWLASVEVKCAEVTDLVATMPSGQLADAVVARGFGPPLQTLKFGASLVQPGGLIVISEPPDGDRWDPDRLRELGVRRHPVDRSGDRIAVFARTG